MIFYASKIIKLIYMDYQVKNWLSLLPETLACVFFTIIFQFMQRKIAKQADTGCYIAEQ